MKVVAIIQARMGSNRLPGKTLLPLAGEPMLARVVERLQRATKLDKIIVATSTDARDDAIEALCRKHGYEVYRGSEGDVLDRYYQAAKTSGCNVVVRLTADNPLLDPIIIDQTIETFLEADCDYVSNVVPGIRTFPLALAVEVFTLAALERAYTEATQLPEREHVTPYIWQNKKGFFHIGSTLQAPSEYAYPELRLTVDFPEDYDLMKKIYELFYHKGNIISTPAVIQYLNTHPEAVAINAFRDKGQVKI